LAGVTRVVIQRQGGTRHEHESFDELMSRLACRMRKAAAPLFSSLILLIFQPYFAGFRSLTTHMVLVDELHPAISSALCLWGVAGIVFGGWPESIRR
jgi:hypothetical protein